MSDHQSKSCSAGQKRIDNNGKFDVMVAEQTRPDKIVGLMAAALSPQA